MSSFAGEYIFDSGPHRVVVGARGEQLARSADVAGDPSVAGEQAVGPLDGQVLVRGRLVADTDDALTALVESIQAMLTHPPMVGDLIDNHSATLKDVSFVSFTPADRVDRGARVSLGYVARFVKFGGWA